MASEEIAYPSHIKFDTLKQIIRGWFMAGAQKEEKSREDVSHVTGIHKDDVGRNSNFFVYLKVLETTKRGRYRLTDLGGKLGAAIDHDLEDQAKTSLLTLCNDNELCQKIFNFSKTPRTKEEVINQAANIAGIPSSDRHKMTGIGAVVDMMLWCGMLEEKDGQIAAATYKIEEKVPGGLPPSKPPIKEISTKEAPFLPIILSVTPDTPKEKVKEMVKWVLEAYDEYRKGKAEVT